MNADIRLTGAPNFRDLGGYSTSTGRQVRRGRLFRSEALNQLTAQDYAVLQNLGIRLVCDLRSDLERSLKPTVWPEHLLPATLVMDVNADLRSGNAELFDLLRADPSAQGARAMMLHIYRWVPDALIRHLSNFFASIIEQDHLPLILHCSAGKDRTGVLSAILLLALGVPRETVVADYLKTNQYRDLARLRIKLIDLMQPIIGHAPSEDMIEVMAGVEAKYLDAALAAIAEQHGALETYLAAAGVGAARLDEFRARMLE